MLDQRTDPGMYMVPQLLTGAEAEPLSRKSASHAWFQLPTPDVSAPHGIAAPTESGHGPAAGPVSAHITG